MGLFSMKADFSKYDKYYRPDGYNDELFKQFKYDYEHGFFQDFNVNNCFKARDYLVRQFLRSMLTEEATNWLMKKDYFQDILKAWGIDEIYNKDNVFVAVMKNKKFIPLMKKIDAFRGRYVTDFINVYNSYVNCVFDSVEYANDPDSVIYDENLYKNHGGTDFTNIVSIDYQLINDKEKRNRILYENGVLKSYPQIEKAAKEEGLL